MSTPFHWLKCFICPFKMKVGFPPVCGGLSEDPGPHAVLFSCVRRAGRGGGIQGVSVVVVAGFRILDPGSWIQDPESDDDDDDDDRHTLDPTPLPALRIQEKNTA